ncbi:4Fe-4S dicluster domain-containing protein [bacterium BFN5]|nr:4Fe-4S dicluster domain-containing protein [bacterium BFN5]QJW47254.1 4Fe-4S dicluster domain-containing protein [bacterium BFN5]
MPGLKTLPQNRDMITNLLDTAWSPVAKMRLLSGGISPNNLLDGSDEIVGQKACIACGNCVDACPVVLRELDCVQTQTNRNSLYLETIVDDKCLRCYQCIQACPQVDRAIKLTAARHRIAERLAHWWLGIAYIITAISGILIYHSRNDWSPLFALEVSAAHKFGAIMWLLSPVLFFLFDRYHFARTLKAITSLGWRDVVWWKEFITSVFTKAKRPFEGEYNSGQKTWYIVVLGSMVVLGVSGIARWGWEDSMDAVMLKQIILIHTIAARVIDISFAYHFGRKLLMRVWKRSRHIFRDSYSCSQKKIEQNKTGYCQLQPPAASSIKIQG